MDHGTEALFVGSRPPSQRCMMLDLHVTAPPSLPALDTLHISSPARLRSTGYAARSKIEQGTTEKRRQTRQRRQDWQGPRTRPSASFVKVIGGRRHRSSPFVRVVDIVHEIGKATAPSRPVCIRFGDLRCSKWDSRPAPRARCTTYAVSCPPLICRSIVSVPRHLMAVRRERQFPG